MRDSYGREIDYMRISITDRCNLRCVYCMPKKVPSVPMAEILTFEEIQKIAACGARLGIRHLKVTGGEPLVRKGCTSLVGMLKAVPGIETVTLTTNGIYLREHLSDLVDAGIDGINISLDTLDRECYRQLTGFDALPQVLEALKEAADAKIRIKVNAVSIQGLNEKNWRQVIEIARRYPVDVRLIEMMPIGYGQQFQTVDHQVLLSQMRKEYPEMERDSSKHGWGPAVYWKIPGFLGSIGFISAIHGKFCGSCNRLRLTAQGFLKPCLCYEEGIDLKAILRGGGSLEDAMRTEILRKPKAHCFEAPEKMTEHHLMQRIGG